MIGKQFGHVGLVLPTVIAVAALFLFWTPHALNHCLPGFAGKSTRSVNERQRSSIVEKQNVSENSNKKPTLSLSHPIYIKASAL